MRKTADSPHVTQARVRELLDYDPDTGLFRWRAARGGAVKAGDAAGSLMSGGYVVLGLDARYYLAHRLAWLYVYGTPPAADVDHVDGDKANNRISNLRDVSRSVNCQNQRRAKAQNLSGFLGVRVEGRRWSATIQPPGGRSKHIGTFDTPEQAHAAYVAAKRVMHAGCTI